MTFDPSAKLARPIPCACRAEGCFMPCARRRSVSTSGVPFAP